MDHFSNTGHETAVCWIDLSCRCLVIPDGSALDELAAHWRPALDEQYFKTLIQITRTQQYPCAAPSAAKSRKHTDQASAAMA